MIYFFSFLATIPAANWLIGNFGVYCIPDGPCLIPVGFGLDAPSGVLMVGAALVLRDMLHRAMGWIWALAAIAIGSMVSWVVAPAEIVLASASAFALSETINQIIYAPLYRRRLISAVLVSSVVGAILDSALFLWLAFGSIDYIAGQVLGKLWMICAATLLLATLRAKLAE
jgi:uncharacterized PurR-regulated membrane protein YhhQ (DUF165 family)